MGDANNENSFQPQDLPEAHATQKQLSFFARWSFRFLIFGLICFVASAIFSRTPSGSWNMAICGLFSVVAFLIAIVAGIIALFHIGCSKKRYKGILRSLVSILIPIIIFSFWCYFMMGLAYRLMCGVNVEGLGKALVTYCNDYKDNLPTEGRWCDLLVERADVDIRQFLCRGSDSIMGESDYAMNKYIINMSMSEIPKDVVVLFETDYGRTPKRWWQKHFSIENSFYSISESNGIPKVMRSDKLDKLRWNQIGGPEILTCEHHRGKGCLVLFGDNHVEFIRKQEIPKLQWKP